MRILAMVSKQLAKNWCLNGFHTNRNGLLINKWAITKRCPYSTATNLSSTATDAVIPPPATSADAKQYPEKIHKIVTDISNLTLIEVSELNELLKKTLNIADTPVMAMAAMPSAAQPQEEEEEDVGVKTVQTSFTLKLNKFDDTKKVALIKEIKAVVEGMNLVQAKKFVESTPQVIKANLSKDEAEKLKAQLEAVGGVCAVE